MSVRHSLTLSGPFSIASAGGARANLPIVAWKARLIDPEELEATIDLTAVAFGAGPQATENYRKQAALLTEPDRVFVVADGEVLAGTAASFSLALALPGGGTLPLAGVTEVGVSPAYRRRGVLRTLMEAVHDQAARSGRADRRVDGQRRRHLPAVRVRGGHPVPVAVHRPDRWRRGRAADRCAGRGVPERRPCRPHPAGVRGRGRLGVAGGVGALLAPGAGRGAARRPLGGRCWHSTSRRTATGPAPALSRCMTTPTESPTASSPIGSSSAGRARARCPTSCASSPSPEPTTASRRHFCGSCWASTSSPPSDGARRRLTCRCAGASPIPVPYG